MKATRPGTRRKIVERLARHSQLMRELMERGMARDDASAEAFRLITGKPSRKPAPPAPAG